MTSPSFSHAPSPAVAPTSEDKLISAIAAGFVAKADIAQKHVRDHVFEFSGKFVRLLIDVKNEQVQAEKSDRVPSPQVKPIESLGHSDEDAANDNGIQRMLERVGRKTGNEIIDCAQKGREFATEITSYAMYLGGVAVEVLRTKSGSDPEEPIVYTLNTLDTTAVDTD